MYTESQLKVRFRGSTCPANPRANGVKTYLRYLRYGFSSKTQKLSALIRDEQITREKAMDIIKDQNEGEEPKELDRYLDLLDIKKERFERIKRGIQEGILGN